MSRLLSPQQIESLENILNVVGQLPSTTSIHVHTVNAPSMSQFLERYRDEIRLTLNAANYRMDADRLSRIAQHEVATADPLHHQSHPRLRRRWAALMTFTPSDEQLRRISDRLRRVGGICDLWLKVFVILAAVYLFAEFGAAFLPGGPVERLLGGR
jgi:hypothetical protein